MDSILFQLQQSTDLFKNHKAAQVLSDQSAFQAVQSSVGLGLLFGVGDDNILYLSAEQTSVATAFTPIDLTTELAAFFPGQTVTAKSFAVTQSTTTGNITVAQIVHVAETGNDELFAMSDLSNAPAAAWMESATNRTWTALPYDDTQYPQNPVVLSYVELPVSDDPSQAPYLVVGVVQPTTSFIQTFLVNLNATSGAWTLFPTAENFDTLDDMCIGKPGPAMFPGLYQLYTLNNEPSLTFTAWKALFGPPDARKFTLPAGATSIACTPGGSGGETDLYVAGSGGIYLFPAASQSNGATGIEIISDPSILNVEYLQAHATDTQITVWGRTNAGTVFYARCAAGSQQTPSAWTAPISIAAGVDQVATMLDLNTGTSIIFAHQVGQQVLKLTQDPVTTAWLQTSLLLPALAIDDVYEFYTYTTKIVVTDSSNLPLANQDFQMYSTSPCTVYVDGTYMALSPTVPLTVTADASGGVTIVQETTSMASICYQLAQSDGTMLSVNPMSNSVQRMSGIQNGSQLSAVNVTDEWGNTTPLVNPSQPAGNVDAVAQGINQFVQTSQTLPANGTNQTTPPKAALAFDATADSVWGMKFDSGTISYYDGLEGVAAMGVRHSAGVLTMEVGDNWLEAWAGDIWRKLEHALDDLKQFIVKVADGVTHFFVQIGEALYHFVMKCVNDVAHAIEVVLKAIEVGLEKLVQWIGFIFSWDDILRTHKALKNIFKQYAYSAAANLTNYRADLKTTFTNVENAVNEWAGLPDVPGTANSSSSSGQRPAGSSSPQAHYGSDQTKNNASSSNTDYVPSFGSGSELEQLLQEFSDMLNREETAFTTAYQNLKVEVIDQIGTIPIKTVIERLIAIIFDVLWETVENAVLSAVDIIAILVEGVVDVLDAPLNIPVLTWLYKEITGGDQLSILDLCCLISAIPVTIIVKLVAEVAPFPKGAFTDSIINAKDFATIQQIYQSSSTLALPGADGTLATAKVSPDVVAILNLTSGIAAYFGTIGIMIFSAVKFADSSSLVGSIFYSVSYLFYVAPDITGMLTANKITWDVTMNTAVTGVGFVKSLVDISLTQFVAGQSGKALTFWKCVSPSIEALINVAWQIPVCMSIARDHKSAGSIVGFIGNTAFDAGGWITPGTEYPQDEKVKFGFFVATLVCAGVYGELMLVQGLLNYES